MSGWLLATNVLSELRRPRPNRRVVEFINLLPETQMFVSVVTFAEIRKGIAQSTDPERREALRLWLDNNLRPMFEGRVIDASEEIVLQYLMIVDRARRQRRTLTYPDFLLAATALHTGLTVVTRNIDDFEFAAAKVVNPWTQP